MKKLFYTATLVALSILAASCQRENLEPLDAQVVTYTVQLPDAIGTKALRDGMTLHYEVYRTDAEKATDFTTGATLLYHKEEAFENGVVNLDLELVNNQNFTVLFWAQTNGNDAFDCDDLTNVTISTDLKANQDNYAVFSGHDFIKSGEQLTGRKIKLVRPVAQLNIATTAASLASFKSTVAIENSSVKLTGKLATSYNVATLAAGTAADVVFTYSAQEEPSGEFKADYPYVAMNYVAFVDADGENVKVDYTIKTSVGDITNTIGNVPLKPNYRTNILGNLITETSDYTVNLSATWPTDEENVEVVAVSTAADLQDAINNISDGAEGNIKLEGDIDLGALAGMISTKAGENPYGLLIPAGKTIILDLNGCTLKQEVECKASYSMIKNQGNLTITGNGTIRFKDLSAGGGSEWGSYIIDNTGYLTVENGTIVHLGSTNFTDRPTNLPIQNYAGKVVINGGIISSPSFRSLRDFTAGGEIIINGGQFLGQVWMQGLGAGSSSLTINGGEFNPTAGYDGSSVYITNGTNDVQVSIIGGTFNTKIGCADSNKSGVKGCVTGGQFKADPSAFVAYGYPVIAPETEGGYYTIGQYTAVAKIGDKEYGSLNAAVAEVEDGQTITLIEDEVFTLANRTYNSGSWYDGLYYIGDKSFTIDLNDKTIKHDGAVNDYLLNFKNDGAKANTITLKNGTIDAGTAAFCALATASSNTQKMTINLENINLINNIYNGATIKFRGGAELNVKAGTVITGKNSYTGIEAVGNTTIVNIYEGAKIYQNGTSSSWGWLVGASYNATVNVYGGEGKSAKGAFGAMTSGGTINISGGEWIANNDGTIANDNNGVLIAQSDKQYNSGAGNAVVNVTGGTFKGGYNCYGNAVGDAQINIKGGNFNANPSAYVANDYKAVENNGIWNVAVDPAAKIGSTEYATLQEAFNVGGNITLLRDVTVSETVTLAGGKTAVLDLNGKTLSAADKNTLRNDGGNLTIKNGTVTRTGDVVGYSVNNASGEISVENATIARGLYTSGTKLTANNANISHNQSSRHAIYSSNCEVTINSGTFHNDNAGNATLMAAGSSVVTINGGTFSIADGRSTLGWTSCMIDQNGTAQVIVKDGLFNGGFRINSANTTLTIEGGEFNTNNGSAYTDYSGAKVVKGGKFTDTDAQNWAKKYIADGYEMNANGEVVAK